MAAAKKAKGIVMLASIAGYGDEGDVIEGDFDGRDMLLDKGHARLVDADDVVVETVPAD